MNPDFGRVYTSSKPNTSPAHRFDPFPESRPPLAASIRAGAAMAMSTIRSALARASLAPKLRAPHRFAATAAAGETQPERVAAEMVRYALGGAVHRSSPGFPLVLVRIRAVTVGGGEGSAEAVGLLMLAMSTLLYRSGRRQDAMEKLKASQQVAPSASFRVAAWEALMGLHMEAGDVPLNIPK